MRWTLAMLVGCALAVVCQDADAIDVNPSKETIPRDSFDTGGNRFSIFNGDPKRIQRANEVSAKSFDTKLEVSPNPLSLKSAEQAGPNPSVKVTFSIQNHAKRTYTLSFPTSQRWDFRVLNAAGTTVYSYTEDHEFVPVVGTSMVNQGDRLDYSESVEFADFDQPLVPGLYTVEAVMANYPEMQAKVKFVVQD